MGHLLSPFRDREVFQSIECAVIDDPRTYFWEHRDRVYRIQADLLKRSGKKLTETRSRTTDIPRTMDTRGCPEGMASDRVMLYGNDFVPFSCDTPIVAHIGVFTALSIVRAAMCVAQFLIWRDREQKVKLRSGKARSRRPVVPLLSLFSASVLILFTILTSLDVANASNGAPYLMLSLFYFPLGIAGLLTLTRIVNLGKRLIPFSRINTRDNKGPSHLDQLNKVTTFLRILYVLDIAAVLVSPLAAIVGLFLPVFATVQVAVMSYVAQNVFIGVGAGYQYQRVINGVRACAYSDREAPASGISSGAPGKQRQDISKAIRKLRFQQLILLLCAPWTAIVWILVTSRAVLPRYWMIAIMLSLEIIVTFLFILSHLPSIKTGNGKKQHTEQPGDNNTTDGGDTSSTSPAVRPLSGTATASASRPTSNTNNAVQSFVQIPSSSV